MRKPLKEWLLLVAFYLLVFQSPLSEVHSLFGYIDELFALLGIGVVASRILTTGKLRIKKIDLAMTAMLVVFLTVGLLGNAIYQYQPLGAVLTDTFTNVKFFMSLVSGYVLFSYCEPDQEKSVIIGHARLITLVLFACLCLDLVFQVFPSEGTRYGLREVRLFFFHETYLAGAAVFLLTVFLAFYEKKSLPYIFLCLLVLISTLKGKAFTAAIAFVFLFYVLVYRRKKIKVWHVIVLALGGLLVAGDQISYYFVEKAGESARMALMSTSFEIMGDYFPIGTGFGTYGSATAIDPYSPVYYKYGLNLVWGLSEDYNLFASDSFWPIIIGQTGALGLVCFVGVLVLLFVRMKKIRPYNIRAYAAALFGFAYILICSTAEPAFHNSVSVPLAMMIGYAFTLEKKEDAKCLKN
jgi:hypothetical protein